MKKTYFMFLFVIILMFTLQPAFADTLDYTDKADKLNALGLFNGTAIGYELERVPNRAEAAAMLIRLLGAEEEANKMNYSHPFTDVPSWADSIIGYMYEKGLTKGIGNNLYGSFNAASSKDFSTFMLRTLGYDGDFNYNDALSFAAEKGILTSKELEYLKTENFKRNEMVLLSYNTLKANLKNQSATLAELLSEQGVLKESDLFDAGISDRIEETISNLNSSYDFTSNLIQTDVEKSKIQIIPSQNGKETLEDGFEGQITFNNEMQQWQGLDIKYEIVHYYKGKYVKTTKFIYRNYGKEENQSYMATPYDKFDELKIVAYPLSAAAIKNDLDNLLEIVTTDDTDMILSYIVENGNFSGSKANTDSNYTTYSDEDIYKLSWILIFNNSNEYADGQYFRHHPHINVLDKSNSSKYKLTFNEQMSGTGDDFAIIILKSSDTSLGYTYIYDKDYNPIKIFLVK